MLGETPTPPRSVRLFMVAAERLGIEARLIDPGSGYLLELRQGDRMHRVLGSLSGLNSAVAARLSQDKLYTELVLRQAGFQTPESVGCIRPGHYQDAAYETRTGTMAGLEFAARRGYPMVVKPNRMALGRHVYLAEGPDQLERAMHAVWQDDYMALVQTVAYGHDLRLNILDGQFLVGYWRHASVITGDGQRTVARLLADGDDRFTDTDHLMRCTRTQTWARCVSARGLELDSVLSQGQILDFDGPILDVRYFATFCLVENLPEQWLAWCTRIAHTLELRYLGIDLEVPDPSRSFDLDYLHPQASTILETNAAPTMNRLCKLGHQERAIAAQMRVLQAIFA